MKFVFYGLAIMGIIHIMWKYGRDAWAIDPVATLAVGSCLSYISLLWIGESMGWSE